MNLMSANDIGFYWFLSYLAVYFRWDVVLYAQVGQYRN